MKTNGSAINVNGRRYAAPKQPTVVICVDGCEPDYIAQAVAGGRMPNLKRVLSDGTALFADCVVPSSPTPITYRSSPARRLQCTGFAATRCSMSTAAPK